MTKGRTDCDAVAAVFVIGQIVARLYTCMEVGSVRAIGDVDNRSAGRSLKLRPNTLLVFRSMSGIHGLFCSRICRKAYLDVLPIAVMVAHPKDVLTVIGKEHPVLKPGLSVSAPCGSCVYAVSVARLLPHTVGVLLAVIIA